MPYFFPEFYKAGSGFDTFFSLAGTEFTFNSFKIAERNKKNKLIPASQAPKEILEKFIKPRPSFLGLDFNKVNIMGILNVTPDSFYDGEQTYKDPDFIKRGIELIEEGLDILDVGGESTRPGAKELPIELEKRRVTNVIKEIKKRFPKLIISIDTRKSEVAKEGLKAGASIINDISGLTFDKEMLSVVSNYGSGICIMHSKGKPEKMQNKPIYENALLDIYDFIEDKVVQAKEAGIPEENIIIDPGIGFGKNLSHNKSLISNLRLFHGLGCPIMIGLSRKTFIGEIVGEPNPSERLGGSIAAMLKAISKGAQIVRVHDVQETKQAIAVWNSLE